MPDIGQPSASDKNSDDEIRDAVVSDATRFPGGFIDQQITESGAPVQIVGQFQLNNASFFQSLDVVAQDGNPQGVAIRSDGSQLYFVGLNNANVYQYSLSTAYDVSTASFDLSFDVSPQDTSTRGLDFRPDGTSLYIGGRDNANIYQYNLSTAYDVSSASFVRSLDISSQDGRPNDLVFRPDGTSLYFLGQTNNNVYQYSLSTAYDISSASFVRSFSVSGQDVFPQGLTLKPDGSKLYVSGSDSSSIHQYSLSTAYDISTASLTFSFDVSTQDAAPSGLTFKPDGNYLYVAANGDDAIDQYAVGIVGGELG